MLGIVFAGRKKEPRVDLRSLNNEITAKNTRSGLIHFCIHYLTWNFCKNYGIKRLPFLPRVDVPFRCFSLKRTIAIALFNCFSPFSRAELNYK